MSLWYCPEHGLTGPTSCCSRASRATVEPAPSSPSPGAGSEPPMRDGLDDFPITPSTPIPGVSSPASEHRGEPMTEERLAEIRKMQTAYATILSQGWTHRAIDDLLAEVARLRPTGEPSPDLAALLET